MLDRREPPARFHMVGKRILRHVQAPNSTLPPQNLIADLLSSFSHLLWIFYGPFSTCSAIGRKAAQPPQNTAKSTLAGNMEQVKSGDSPCFWGKENPR
jgi:hypothetical protein